MTAPAPPKKSLPKEILSNTKGLMILGGILSVALLISGTIYFIYDSIFGTNEPVAKVVPPPKVVETATKPVPTPAPTTSPPNKSTEQIEYEARINRRVTVKTPPPDIYWTEANQVILNLENERRALITELSEHLGVSPAQINAPQPKTGAYSLQQASTQAPVPVVEPILVTSSWMSLSEQLIQTEKLWIALVNTAKQRFSPTLPVEPTPAPVEKMGNTNELHAQATTNATLLLPTTSPAESSENSSETQLTTMGYRLVLEDISFEADSADLLAGTLHKLNKFAAILEQYPNRFVLIEGHADDQGDSTRNITLSQQRAEAVRFALMTSGVAKERMILKSYGDTLPLANNNTEAGRLKNRRVEITLLNEGIRTP
ncbi:OmpA family protein [Beggiatoa leptomitoformis]|uniref:OmpA family protein n=1 Tax=Beggiatoa leptomitoformis TaxID=288004 RepID=A0A2N9YBA0_9GAMM|nr:OmpA family protein [Beggiatoa leptomitoformis]AUI67724.1 OmpA family protein [Beggiatoa leptomitoformis]QGX03517.1 OmpA family protein [Beggiatoa leptomitoformis]